MRVGIVTLHYMINPGAVLQTLGLSKTLRSLGYDPVVINYIPPSERLLRLSYWGLRSGHMRSGLISRFRYHNFTQRHLPLSRPYYSRSSIRRDAKGFHAFIVGSDQVWNPAHFRLGYYDPIYLLGFAEGTSAIRASYAACVGQPNQPEKYLAEMRSKIGSLDSISVRNELSRDMVKQWTGRDSTVVVDPTFLASYEEEAAPPIEKGKYLLLFAIDRAMSLRLAPAVCELARRLSLPIVAVTRDSIPGVDRYHRDVGPSEWLALFRDASYVFTDSYHGVVFSIKNHKPFAAYVEPGWRSHRLLDQLGRYGLTGRMVGPDWRADTLPYGNDIDYAAVDRAVRINVEASREYLRSALSGVTRGVVETDVCTQCV